MFKCSYSGVKDANYILIIMQNDKTSSWTECICTLTKPKQHTCHTPSSNLLPRKNSGSSANYNSVAQENMQNDTKSVSAIFSNWLP